MIGNTGTVLAFDRVRLIAAVVGLIAAPCFAHAGDDPRKKEKLPDGVTEVGQDDLDFRMPNFFYFDYPFEPQPGKRLWLRVDDKHWLERYPDGMETRFKVVGRAKAQGLVGTIVVRLVGEPEEADNFQVFITDRCEGPMRLYFREGKDEQAGWSFLGDMKKVE